MQRIVSWIHARGRGLIGLVRGLGRRFRVRALVRDYVLKDLSRETSMESFLQTVTIVLSILAVWFIVASRTAIGTVHEFLGTPIYLFDTPSVYDTVVGLYDFLSFMVQSVSGLDLEAAMRDSVADAASALGAPVDVSPTLFGFACASMRCVFWELPLKLLALLMLSMFAVARLRTLAAIPLIAALVLYGAFDVRETTRLGVAGVTHGLVRSVFVHPERVFAAAGPVSWREPGTTTDADDWRWQQRAFDLEVAPLSYINAFELTREADGHVSTERGVLLFCLQHRCPYLPLRDVAFPLATLPLPDSPATSRLTLTVWDVDRGIGILRLDDSSQRLTLLGSSTLAKTAAAPHAMALIDPGWWRAREARPVAVAPPSPVTVSKNPIGQPVAVPEAAARRP